jgi:DNA-binding winged helix-turn-helix (wHTH) protein/tetratricopeptide (TPR) repeat protein
MPVAAFGPFVLDLDSGELRRSGVPVRLQPQPAKLLVLLVGRAGELVAREEIREHVWGTDTFVDFDQSVNFCVRQVRTALHDDASTPCYIETLPRRGYRFIAPVAVRSDEPPPAPVSPGASTPRRRSLFIAAGVLAASAVIVGLAAAMYGHRMDVEHEPSSSGRDARARQESELGRFFLDKFTNDALQIAIAHFEAALRIDPDFAPAYAGLAEAYNQQASVFLSKKRPGEVRLLALRAATRAIQLDPTIAEAHAALGYATMHEMDWPRAGAALRRAIELNPRYVPAHQIYAAYLANQMRVREAVDEARRAVDLEPASVRARATLAWMLYFARDYDAAIREQRVIQQMDPAFASGHFGLGEVYLVSGQASAAVSELERAVELGHRTAGALGLLGMALGAAGRRDDARRIVDELEARAQAEHVAPGALLLAYLGIGDKQRAVDMIVRGYEERDNYEINIVVDPLMDSLRDDPRFEAVCRRVMQGSFLDPRHLRRTESIARR